VGLDSSYSWGGAGGQMGLEADGHRDSRWSEEKRGPVMEVVRRPGGATVVAAGIGLGVEWGGHPTWHFA
jgi:hypothetical protein